ncbi:hypothetical protein BJX66DRAFT_319919 [Aspergillus keveii]|uniref:Uncharacterized protein n=1 Tax=Aspergillus keveii TaxID=714993 RepID=A0ABR4FHP6_9EURO
MALVLVNTLRGKSPRQKSRIQLLILEDYFSTLSRQCEKLCLLLKRLYLEVCGTHAYKAALQYPEALMEIFEEIDYSLRVQTEILVGIQELLRGRP